MKALYIGILSDGTTSRMRADTLRRLTLSTHWDAIDTDQFFRRAKRLWKSTAFRLKAGPLVGKINQQIIQETAQNNYDLIWVDKGIYVWLKTVLYLRKRTKCLVHFTPDSAFHANRSRHFFSAAHQFDLLVTTKSFELDNYYAIADENRVYLTTQAYDSALHRPLSRDRSKKKTVVFIGLCEPDREQCIEALLSAGVPVRLGGRGWSKFVKRHSLNANLHFLGEEVFGDEYVAEYASASVGLGLLSKRFPELHTTRTFEIPACGTMLATERNDETIRFFHEDEVLFFENYMELAKSISRLLDDADRVEEVSKKGHQRVIESGHDYASVLSGVLHQLEDRSIFASEKGHTC